MKVGILTLPLLNNYGGILQAAALYYHLERQGHEPLLLSKKFERPRHERVAGAFLRAIPGQNIRNIRRTEAVRARHYPFIERHFPRRTAALYTLAELDGAVRKNRIDAVIVGSDQVWRPTYMSDRDTRVFFLDLDTSARKIAYAASLGKSEWSEPERVPEVARMLADFHAVSVRETSALDICRNVLDRADCAVALDPTLLVDRQFYAALAMPGPRRGQYLLNYVLDASPVLQSVSAKVADAAGIGDVCALSLDDGAQAATIPEWVAAFRSASFVVTDSFHGTVMAILFRKPFVAIANMERGIDRFTSLLDQLGLRDRLITDAASVDPAAIVARPIDFDAVDRRLDELRAASREFLDRALA